MLTSLFRISLRRQLTIAIIPGLFTLAVVITAYTLYRDSVDVRHTVEQTRDVLGASGLLLQRVIDAETGVRAYVATGDSAFLQPYYGAQHDAASYMAELGRLSVGAPARQAQLEALDTAATARFAAFQAMITSRAVDGFRTARAQLASGKEGMDSLRAIVAAIDADARASLALRDTREVTYRRVTGAIILIGGLLAVLVAFLANRVLARTILQLNDANGELSNQALRLEEQATELETQAAELEASATELEAANAELEEQAAELEEQRDVAQSARVTAEQANAAKSRFLSTMSHELRTPLNAVTGYVDLIDAGVHGPVTTEQREDIRRIKRAVSQLTSVINDILNFAKLEAGEARYSMGDVCMHEALANASALMEPQAKGKGVEFAYEGCDPTLTAFADRERVQQVVLNLLSNAVKYTDKGGNVTLRCTSVDGMVHVVVSDTGRGIHPDDIDRIFDPFVQLLGSTHSPSDGVGLGLAIGRELARGMGGDVAVDSVLGVGSNFRFTLRAV